MRKPTQSSQLNSKHTLINNKTKPNSKPGRQISQEKTPEQSFVFTTNDKNDVDVDKAGIVNNTDTENIDIIKEMDMNCVNRTQSQQVVTPCTGLLQRTRTCVNMDLQNELSKESEEESSTESIGKQPKTLSENDDNY